MQDSILMTIRKLVCGDPYADHFDTDLLVHINACFSILNQLGVGPSEGFRINDEYATWNEFISDDENLELVKSYMVMKVKLLFDPPQSSIVMEATNRMISEAEWRLNVAVESSGKEETQNE